MTTWQTEFSDFDDMPAIPENWKDISWHNDSCPSFECGELLIFVDYADPEKREVATPFRFVVVNDPMAEAILETDDWAEVLAAVELNR